VGEHDGKSLRAGIAGRENYKLFAAAGYAVGCGGGNSRGEEAREEEFGISWRRGVQGWRLAK